MTNNKKCVGIISYNIYGAFTNYGSALQSWALNKVLQKKGINSILVDYCPRIHRDKNILNPLDKMWDQDEESLRNTRLTLPAIEENYWKFEDFFNREFNRTKIKYNEENFETIIQEDINRFICGSDTIFCIEESKGFDDGYFANFPIMRKNSIAYAASFGDTKILPNEYIELEEKLKNFKAIGLRENRMLDYVSKHTDIPVRKTIDPTLLLDSKEYDSIVEDRLIEEKYLLLYTRRYNSEMQKYAENIARNNGWKIVEISLRATNEEKGHIMMYKAGVEEFLSLVKYAEYVVTNSFHGLIFSVQFRKQFSIFSRESGDSKIEEALELFGLQDHLLHEYQDSLIYVADYDEVHKKIAVARENSIEFLEKELELL